MQGVATSTLQYYLERWRVEGGVGVESEVVTPYVIAIFRVRTLSLNNDDSLSSDRRLIDDSCRVWLLVSDLSINSDDL